MPFIPLLAAAALCVGPVHDGDTIRTCAGERVRIANIDAPEMRGSPKCQNRQRRGRPGWCNYPLAIRSRDALIAFLRTGPARIERSGVDRYGRTLATISVGGRDAGDHLIATGLARRW